MNRFKKPYVRFLNADAYGRNTNFYINGKPVAENISFGQSTGYMSVPEGTAKLTVSCTGCDCDNEGINIAFGMSSVYTVSSVNIGDEVSLLGINEIFDTDSRSMGYVRICNLSVDIDEADVYANRYQILGDIEFLEVSKYIAIIPDIYEFTIRDDDSEKIILNCGKQTVKSGKFNTLYIIGRINENPSLRCVFTTDAMSYNGEYL